VTGWEPGDLCALLAIRDGWWKLSEGDAAARVPGSYDYCFRCPGAANLNPAGGMRSSSLAGSDHSLKSYAQQPLLSW
jgi:hypothetical protein